MDSSGTWPQAGTMQNGQCYQHPISVRLINAKDFLCSRTDGTGFLTPNRCDGDQGGIVTADRLGALVQTGQPLKRKDGGEYQSKPVELYLARAITAGTLTMEEALSEKWIINPQFYEWLMGLPIGWTDLEDLETPLSLKSQSGSGNES